jgi:hypothetical protein
VIFLIYHGKIKVLLPATITTVFLADVSCVAVHFRVAGAGIFALWIFASVQDTSLLGPGSILEVRTVNQPDDAAKIQRPQYLRQPIGLNPILSILRTFFPDPAEETTLGC